MDIGYAVKLGVPVPVIGADADVEFACTETGVAEEVEVTPATAMLVCDGDPSPPAVIMTGSAVMVVTYGSPESGSTVVVICRGTVIVKNMVVVDVRSSPAPRYTISVSVVGTDAALPAVLVVN